MLGEHVRLARVHHHRVLQGVPADALHVGDHRGVGDVHPQILAEGAGVLVHQVAQDVADPVELARERVRGTHLLPHLLVPGAHVPVVVVVHLHVVLPLGQRIVIQTDHGVLPGVAGGGALRGQEQLLVAGALPDPLDPDHPPHRRLGARLQRIIQRDHGGGLPGREVHDPLDDLDRVDVDPVLPGRVRAAGEAALTGMGELLVGGEDRAQIHHLRHVPGGQVNADDAVLDRVLAVLRGERVDVVPDHLEVVVDDLIAGVDDRLGMPEGIDHADLPRPGGGHQAPVLDAEVVGGVVGGEQLAARHPGVVEQTRGVAASGDAGDREKARAERLGVLHLDRELGGVVPGGRGRQDVQLVGHRIPALGGPGHGEAVVRPGHQAHQHPGESCALCMVRGGAPELGGRVDIHRELESPGGGIGEVEVQPGAGGAVGVDHQQWRAHAPLLLLELRLERGVAGGLRGRGIGGRRVGVLVDVVDDLPDLGVPGRTSVPGHGGGEVTAPAIGVLDPGRLVAGGQGHGGRRGPGADQQAPARQRERQG